MAGAPDVPLQTRMVDDKSPICIPFILERLQAHRERSPDRPFVVGLNGVQGVGKTTLVKALAETLQDREGLPTLVVSIDDFYLTHADQLALAEAHPDNALVQYRGEPGTHDIALAKSVFEALCAGAETAVPQYDKAAFSGLGDRAPQSQWPRANAPGQPRTRVVILEGWCVGFRALGEAAVAARWRGGDNSNDNAGGGGGDGGSSHPAKTLHRHKLEHLLLVDGALRAYDALTDLLDAFVHVDAADTAWVYDWRLEQEAALRRERGAGMTDEQVVRFVDGYYPAYELYSDGVRRGVFPGQPGRQLRLVVAKDRSVQESFVI